jgi:hypothetical protein
VASFAQAAVPPAVPGSSASRAGDFAGKCGVCLLWRRAPIQARRGRSPEAGGHPLEVIPKSWKVIQHVREKYSCLDCEKADSWATYVVLTAVYLRFARQMHHHLPTF